VCEDLVLFVSVDLHFPFMPPATSRMRASNSSAVSTFILLTSPFF